MPQLIEIEAPTLAEQDIVLKIAAQIQPRIFQGEVKQINAVHGPRIMGEIVLKPAGRD